RPGRPCGEPCTRRPGRRAAFFERALPARARRPLARGRARGRQIPFGEHGEPECARLRARSLSTSDSVMGRYSSCGHVTLAEGDLRRRVLTIGGSSRIETHEDRRGGECLRANGVPNIRPPRLVTLAMASASNAPRTPRAPRTDGVFLFAALPFATARPLRTLDRGERVAHTLARALSGQTTR